MKDYRIYIRRLIWSLLVDINWVSTKKHPVFSEPEHALAKEAKKALCSGSTVCAQYQLGGRPEDNIKEQLTEKGWHEKDK